MKASDLKYYHQLNHPDSYFFSRKTMRWWGDKMRNFGVYDGGLVWILYRKTVTSNMRGSPCLEWKFCKKTFKRVY